MLFLIHYFDANLMHDVLSGKAVTECLHLTNKTHMMWYSKKQAISETATYGSEFVSGRTYVEQVFDLRVFERKIGELNDYNCWLRSGRDNDAYIAFKETEVYKKAKRMAAIDEIWDHNMFGRGRNIKYAFVCQKRYMRRYKFKFGSRIREHWQRMKDLKLICHILLLTRHVEPQGSLRHRIEFLHRFSHEDNGPN